MKRAMRVRGVTYVMQEVQVMPNEVVVIDTGTHSVTVYRKCGEGEGCLPIGQHEIPGVPVYGACPHGLIPCGDAGVEVIRQWLGSYAVAIGNTGFPIKKPHRLGLSEDWHCHYGMVALVIPLRRVGTARLGSINWWRACQVSHDVVNKALELMGLSVRVV